jgi:hypothetical protein
MDFHKYFENGTIIQTEYVPATVETVPAGELVLPSGSIIACDPYEVAYAKPFPKSVEPGSYKVTLSLVKYIGVKHPPDVAAARITLFNKPAVRWELVPLENERLLGLGGNKGYYSSSHVGCFLDSALSKLLAQDVEQFYDDDTWSFTSPNKFQKTKMGEIIIDMLNKPLGRWSLTTLNKKDNGNIIAFSTGVSGGPFLSYFGYSEDEKIVELLTDFLTIADNDADKSISSN